MRKRTVCKILFLLIITFSLNTACISFPEYDGSKALLGLVIDLDGVGKIGRISENVSLLEINQNFTVSSSSRNGASARNHDPFTVLALIPGDYVIRTIGLGSSTFVCADECQVFHVEGGRNYFAGSYTESITTGFAKITHTISAVDPKLAEADKVQFLEFIQEKDGKWNKDRPLELVSPFYNKIFKRTRSTL